jgi:hypothetical protein
MVKKLLTRIAVFLCLTMGVGASCMYAKTIGVQLRYSNPCFVGECRKVRMENARLLATDVYMLEDGCEVVRVEYDMEEEAFGDLTSRFLCGPPVKPFAMLYVDIKNPRTGKIYSTSPLTVGVYGKKDESVVLDLSTGRFWGMAVDLNPPYI